MKKLFLLSALFALGTMLVACGGDDNDGDDSQQPSQTTPSKDENSLVGWYEYLSVSPYAVLSRVNSAIENHSAIFTAPVYGSDGKRTGQKTNVYAERYMFFDDDHMFQLPNDYKPLWGDVLIDFTQGMSWEDALYFKETTMIHVIDDNTLAKYDIAFLYEKGYCPSGKKVLYTINGGSALGELSYCESPVYLTYMKVDNKMLLYNGDIYTVSSQGLILDGSSVLFKKVNI